MNSHVFGYEQVIEYECSNTITGTANLLLNRSDFNYPPPQYRVK